GRDSILKERLFGLTGNQGNHGEDVKEYYFYLDSTPTHSYMRMLYKYPQAEFPYQTLLDENRRRGRSQPEFELLDTGVFGENRYFDLFVEYAKADVEDILIRITAVNRGPESATLHLLPQFWFRNTWAWGRDLRRPVARKAAFIPGQTGTKMAAYYWLQLAPSQSATLKLRLTDIEPLSGMDPNSAMVGIISSPGHAERAEGIPATNDFEAGFDGLFATRQKEAEEFYVARVPKDLSDDAKAVMRQSFSGM